MNPLRHFLSCFSLVASISAASTILSLAAEGSAQITCKNSVFTASINSEVRRVELLKHVAKCLDATLEIDGDLGIMRGLHFEGATLSQALQKILEPDSYFATQEEASGGSSRVLRIAIIGGGVAIKQRASQSHPAQITAKHKKEPEVVTERDFRNLAFDTSWNAEDVLSRQLVHPDRNKRMWAARILAARKTTSAQQILLAASYREKDKQVLWVIRHAPRGSKLP